MDISDIYIRDPFVLKDGGLFYLYGTTDKQAWSGKAGGFKVYISRDLKEFEEKTVFESGGSFWADENYWAPEVHKIGGMYFMFATFFKKGQGRRCHILASPSPDGRFIPLKAPLTPLGMDCLDATFYKENGKMYTVFCHEWTQAGDGRMCMAELNIDLEIDGGIKTLFKASDAPWVRAMKPGCYVTDGPFLRKANGGVAMLWSSFGVGGYSVGVSLSDGIEGEWRHVPQPLVGCGGGHAMLFENEGKLVLSYHKPNSPCLFERAHFAYVKESENGFELL